jgi:outer membrane receptor protein involved in Fe transport
MSSLTRLHKLLLIFLMGGSVAVSASGAASTLRLSADIGPRPVAEALAAFGRQTGLQLIYVSTIAETQQSKGARAGLTASDALTQLLDGTGLAFEFLNDRTVRIFSAPTVVPTAVVAVPTSPHHASRQASSGELALEEVTVTARRQEEAQSKVPISMAVLSMEDLRNSGVTSIDDIAALVPSANFTMSSELGAGALTFIDIRGAINRNTSATGLYIDDTPVSPALGYTYLRSFPYPFDLDRIEVLRGPQLQLFGEGNQAGAVRFIYNQPSLSTFTARAQGDVAVPAFGDIGYGAGIVLGGPIVRDALGFRVSAWARVDGGFVDRVDLFTGAILDKNDNRTVSQSFRAALLYSVTDAVQIAPSFAYSSFSQHGSQFFFTEFSDVGAGELRNGTLLRTPYDDSFYVGALKVTASLGAIDFSAVSSYFHRAENVLIDITTLTPSSYGDAVGRRRLFQQEVLMQELRLRSADPDASFAWNIAAFYSSKRLSDTDILTGALYEYSLPGTYLSDTARSDQSRLAGFGEVSVRLARGLTLEAGLHGEHASITAVTEVPPILSTAGTDSAVLPQFRLSYQATEHELLYLTASRGYGTGGVWGLFQECSPREPPARIGEDTLWSYEAGAKSGLLDGHLQLDASVFHMLWNNSGTGYSYLNPILCNTVYLAGPGPAVSNGFDISAHALLGTRVLTGVTVAYTDAHYTHTITQDGFDVTRKGEAVGSLPQVVSPWNVTASVEYSVPLSGGAIVTLRAEDIIHSRNPGPFQDDDPTSLNYTPGNVPDPSTNLLNLGATLRRASYDIAVFANNALDARSTIVRRYSYNPWPTSALATTFRPRTVGLSASWRY